MTGGIGDIHLLLGAVPEPVAFIAQDGTSGVDRLGTSLRHPGKLCPVSVDDAATIDDMEEIARHGTLLVQTGGSTRISQSPTPRSFLPVVELNVPKGELFETVRILHLLILNLRRHLDAAHSGASPAKPNL